MSEPSEEQRKFLDAGKVEENGREYVVLRPDEYDRLAGEGYDDSPWDADEMDRLREESVELLDTLGRHLSG